MSTRRPPNDFDLFPDQFARATFSLDEDEDDRDTTKGGRDVDSADSDHDDNDKASDQDHESEVNDEDEEDEGDEEDEEDEEKEIFMPLKADVSELVRAVEIREDKLVTETERAPGTPLDLVSHLCVSKYTFGRAIARGTQAALFEGCDKRASPGDNSSCPYVIRLALLQDLDAKPAKYQKNHESLRQFVRDVEIRRRLADCEEPVPFVRLLDAFVCQDRFGVEVMPRLAGNLMDLVFRAPADRVFEVIEETHRQTQVLVTKMHRCRVLHRDLGFQNLLYAGEPSDFQVMVTDFETAFYSPPAVSQGAQDQAYDAYVHSDCLSLHKLKQELTDLGTLFVALHQARKEDVVQSWQRLDAFVKSALEHAYPTVRERVTAFQQELEA